MKSRNSSLALIYLLFMVWTLDFYFVISFFCLLGLFYHVNYWSDIYTESSWYCSGDNFFKTASYTIEAVCAKSYEDTTQKLQDIEAQILRKRNELRQFESEYRKVTIFLNSSWFKIYWVTWNDVYLGTFQALARYQEVTDRYTKEKQAVCSFYLLQLLVHIWKYTY